MRPAREHASPSRRRPSPLLHLRLSDLHSETTFICLRQPRSHCSNMPRPRRTKIKSNYTKTKILSSPLPVATRSEQNRASDQQDDEEHVDQDAPGSVAKVLPNTPSVIEIAKFKRRPRQPSILRMVEQDLAGDNYGLDDDVEGDETTLATLERSTSPAPDIIDAEPTSPGIIETSSSRKRKRTRDDFDAKPTEPSRLPSSNRDNLEHIPSDPAELTSNRDIFAGRHLSNSSPSLGREQHSLPTHRSTSSSLSPPPEDEESLTPTIRRLRTPPTTRDPIDLNAIDATSPISSPTSSDSPTTPVQAANNRRKQPLKALTTAQLTSLLPRRRQKGRGRAASTFDIHASSSDPPSPSPEDSDAGVTIVTPRRGGAPRAAKRPTKQTPKKRGGIGNNAKSPANTTPGRLQHSARKTYARRRPGRRAEQDKENSLPPEDDSDERAGSRTPPSAQRVRVAASKELSEAKEKFQEVDQWELSFESCDITGGGSSPWR